MEGTKERINELKDKTVEIAQPKQQRKIHYKKKWEASQLLVGL